MIGKTPYEQLSDAHEHLLAENARLKAKRSEADGANQELENLRRDLEIERNRVQQMEHLLAENAHLKAGRSEVDRTSRELENLRRDLEVERNRVQQMEHLLDAERECTRRAEQSFESEHNRATAERKRNELILQSTSWKITAPIRACITIFKR
jgi:chaperonin cofactor prefoldin